MKKIINYVKESYYELVNKVSWPTLQEVTSSSVVVLTASVIIALVILAMDMAFQVQLDATHLFSLSASLTPQKCSEYGSRVQMVLPSCD